MSSRVVGLLVVTVAAVGVLSACNLREGDGSEYDLPAGAAGPETEQIVVQNS